MVVSGADIIYALRWVLTHTPPPPLLLLFFFLDKIIASIPMIKIVLAKLKMGVNKSIAFINALET